MMADSKRQSISKVATPKVGAGKDMPDVGDSLFKAIGGRYEHSFRHLILFVHMFLFSFFLHINLLITDATLVPAFPSNRVVS